MTILKIIRYTQWKKIHMNSKLKLIHMRFCWMPFKVRSLRNIWHKFLLTKYQHHNTYHNDGEMIFIKYVYHNIFCRILYNIEQWSYNNTGSQKRFSLDIEMLFLRLDKEIIVLVMRFVISLFLRSHILNGLNMHILLF